MSDNQPKDGGPAFPQPIDDLGTLRAVNEGMALRDYFAAKAMAAFITRDGQSEGEKTWTNDGELSKWSYETADAMLVERDKLNQP